MKGIYFIYIYHRNLDIIILNKALSIKGMIIMVIIDLDVITKLNYLGTIHLLLSACDL